MDQGTNQIPKGPMGSRQVETQSTQEIRQSIVADYEEYVKANPRTNGDCDWSKRFDYIPMGKNQRYLSSPAMVEANQGSMESSTSNQNKGVLGR